jgi:hypothetical protein
VQRRQDAQGCEVGESHCIGYCEGVKSKCSTLPGNLFSLRGRLPAGAVDTYYCG